MKKIVLIISSFILVFSSCSKKDLQPVDAYSSSTFFTSQAAAFSNLSACYALTNMGGQFEGGNNYFLDDITDNAYCGFTNQLAFFITLGTVTPSLTGKYADFYRTYFPYTGIASDNLFLANIDKVTMDGTLKEQWKAEVRFLRAFDYARKYMFWGGVPLVTTPLNFGDELKIPRSSGDSIVAFCLSELNDVINVLPLTIDQNDAARVTKGAALMLKARLELFYASVKANGLADGVTEKGTPDPTTAAKYYAAAAADSKAIIDLNQYGLSNDYEGLFWEKNQGTPERQKEVMLEVAYKYPTYGSDLSALYTLNEGGWNSESPTQNMVDEYETKNGLMIKNDPSYNPNDPYKNRDPRLSYSVIYPGMSWNGRYFNSISTAGGGEYYNSSNGNRSKTGYCLRKYCAPLADLLHDPGSDVQGLNFIVMRYPEVLLTRAEALIELNQNLGEAASLINQVRQRTGVNMPPIVASDQTTMRAQVRHERRVEFAFEGLRWFDIKRWKIAENTMNGNVLGVHPGTVDANTGAITLTGSNITVGDVRVFHANRDYYFPIPQSDIDLGKPILRQNLNW
ncbi:MAG TPA: RagB/SusD family nutrient uptake outer membrane protein [Arachidicoccus soli]|nr:RagB/SusD family nutrient uptake outer membrane protein [Arachidicoccus soli]